MRSEHTEAQIITALKQLEAGRTADDVAREQGVSKHTIYAWKAKYGGMEVSEAEEVKHLRDENARLIRRLYSEVTRAFPDLNVLINNAGIGLKRNLNDTTGELEDLDQEIKTNLIGPIQMVKQFLPQLKRQKAAAIVNVSFGLAFVPLAVKPIYCATKAALHSYTQSLRVQLKNSPVEVIELAPPTVKTNFNKGQEELNSSSAMDVNKFAKASMRGLELGKEEILPGLGPVARLIGRLAPHAVFMKAEAERMIAQGEQAATRQK